MFKQVSPKVDFPKLEEEIINYWKKHRIFMKSIQNRPEHKKWTFLDGPPFITGSPHYGSLLSSIPKDVFPRFKTMQGYRVRRVWGWDCHGLPAENKVETLLQLKSKREIEEKIGVKRFVEECKKYVSDVSSEWEWYIDHIGRWVDFKNAYKTMDLPYMETVMWVFKQMYDKGYIYKGLRVSLYCPHCATPISNFEVAMDADNYREITDHATTYKYELKSQKTKVNSLTKKAKNNNTYFLAWSTTPWNKIVTPALAVNPKLTYVKVKQKEEFYILAKPTLRILEGKYEVVEEFTGEQLIGMEFVPHYDYYRTKIDKDKKAFVVIGGDFVTADEGTGIVTLAAYGEEDLKVMLENDVHIEMHLDEEGNIKNDVPQFGGMYYLKANKYVNEDLKKRGLIYKDEMIPHNVPLCWRCHTRLYHAPQDAWYVDIQKLKPLLKKTNEYVNWFPKHFKHGRFLKSLESAPDWNISRSRYWGSPVPVWECSCGERFVPGSIKELEDASGQKITELHKPEIDEIKITCKKCGQKVKRVPEVLDSWIEAGSASFAERHFPFNKQEKLEDFFPPDFIAEYTGQIRAWFYVLHVIGAALYSSPAFKNVLVEGVILGTDGRKMSKNYGNYPDPKELLLKYGGDALRLYLLSSPVMNGEDIIISEERYKNQIRGMMLILWNVYNFFVTYANVDRWEPKELSFEKDYFFNEDVKKNVLDRWIIVLLNRLIRDVTNALENFDTVMAVTNLQHFVNDLSTWYIRRSRERVGPTAQSEDIKVAFYETCFYVLTTFCRISAPIMPFLSEFIYRNLTGEESVHLTAWPVWSRKNADDRLEAEMSFARKVVELAHAQRKAKGIMLRQPLISLKTVTPIRLSDQILAVIKDEVNVKKVTNDVGEAIEAELDFRRSKELEEEGMARGIIRQIQEERKKLGTAINDLVNVTLPEWPKSFENEIKRQALVKSLNKGDFRVEKA